MAHAAEHLQDSQPASATRDTPARRGLTSPRAPRETVSLARFLGQVDLCVRQIAAWLGGAQYDAADSDREHCHAQLWRWLHEGNARLDDGTPVDFALFDAAVQRVGERLPRRGLQGQDKLMQAACLLAELTYARTLTEIPACASAP